MDWPTSLGVRPLNWSVHRCCRRSGASKQAPGRIHRSEQRWRLEGTHTTWGVIRMTGSSSMCSGERVGCFDQPALPTCSPGMKSIKTASTCWLQGRSTCLAGQATTAVGCAATTQPPRCLASSWSIIFTSPTLLQVSVLNTPRGHLVAAAALAVSRWKKCVN